MVEKEYLTEFTDLEQTAKERIWSCVNGLYWLCQTCRSVQSKPFEANGVRVIYYKGYELGFGPDVLGAIRHMTDISMPKNLGERLDEYGRLHISYDSCDEAVKNIISLREELLEIMRTDSTDSKQEPY